RQQMQVARTWRLDLRRHMLQEIARLGRDLHQRPVALGYPDLIAGASSDSYFLGSQEVITAAPGARMAVQEEMTVAREDRDDELEFAGEPDMEEPMEMEAGK